MSLKKEDIVRLAEMSRIKVTEDEIEALTKDVDAVLGYVSVIDDITAEAGITKKPGAVYNVLREDEVTNESGSCSEELLEEMPQREGRYLKVKKILHTD